MKQIFDFFTDVAPSKGSTSYFANSLARHLRISNKI
ncbi:hypothetical protein X975_23995, partial [Stegodyphus mimosarum]